MIWNYIKDEPKVFRFKTTKGNIDIVLESNFDKPVSWLLGIIERIENEFGDDKCQHKVSITIG